MSNRDSPIVYICSRYSGDTEKNTEMARRYSRLAVERGCIPVTPHLYLPSILSEETERELALSMDLKLLELCSEIWVCGDGVSEGMRRELEKAVSIGMQVRHISEEELYV